MRGFDDWWFSSATWFMAGGVEAVAVPFTAIAW
jgi:hypothetical protein